MDIIISDAALQNEIHGFDQHFVLPNKVQGERVILFQKICLGFLVINVLVMFALFTTLNDNLINNRVRGNLSLLNTIALFSSSLILSILFLIWIYRAYSNLHSVGISTVRHAKVWSVLAWFIPFLNLVRPYMILKEIWYWKQTKFQDKVFEPENHRWLRYWWISIFIPIPVAMISVILFEPNDHPLRIYYAMQFMSGIFQCVTLYCFYRFFTRIAEIEEGFADRFAEHQKRMLAVVAEEYRSTIGSGTSLPVHDSILPGQGSGNRSEIPLKSSGSQSVIISLYVLLPGFVLLLAGDFFPPIITSTIWLMVVIIAIAAIVFFIGWLNSAYRNLHSVRIKKLSAGENLSAAWWLIPVANIYIPYLMLRDLRFHLQKWPENESDAEDPLPLLDWSWMAFMIAVVFTAIRSALNSSERLNQSDQVMVMILKYGALIAMIFALSGAIYCLKKMSYWEIGFLQKVRNNFKERTDSTAERA